MTNPATPTASSLKKAGEIWKEFHEIKESTLMELIASALDEAREEALRDKPISYQGQVSKLIDEHEALKEKLAEKEAEIAELRAEVEEVEKRHEARCDNYDKTVGEGTARIKALEKETNDLRRLLATERDAFGKRETELMQAKTAWRKNHPKKEGAGA